MAASFFFLLFFSVDIDVKKMISSLFFLGLLFLGASALPGRTDVRITRELEDAFRAPEITISSGGPRPYVSVFTYTCMCNVCTRCVLPCYNNGSENVINGENDPISIHPLFSRARCAAIFPLEWTS